MFAPQFPYSSGNSRQLHDNFENLAQQAQRWLEPGDLVVDIGANDGTLLSKFTDVRTVGVEPTGQCDKIDGPSCRGFFSEEMARMIRDTWGEAKVITACNVLAHVADIGDTMRGIALLLADDGVLIAENHDLASVVDGQWDMVYHEHLRFYSPHSFHRLLDAHGLGIEEWKPTRTHGGSFRMIASKHGHNRPLWPDREYDFSRLAERAHIARDKIRNACKGYAGIGATARGTTIINYCGLDVEDLECVCEVPQSDKIGHYIPGTRIPIVDEKILFDDPRPEVRPGLLLSWHMEDIIVPKLRARGYTKPILVPLPEPHYV